MTTWQLKYRGLCPNHCNRQTSTDVSAKNYILPGFYTHDDDEEASCPTSEDDEDERSSTSDEDGESYVTFTFDGEDDDCFTSDDDEDESCSTSNDYESCRTSGDEMLCFATNESNDKGVHRTIPLFSSYNNTWKFDQRDDTTKMWDNPMAQYHALRAIHENEALPTGDKIYVNEGDHPHIILPHVGLNGPDIAEIEQHKGVRIELDSCTTEVASIAVVTVEGDLPEESRDGVPTIIKAPIHYQRKSSRRKRRVKKSTLYVRMGQLRLPYGDIGREPKRNEVCTEYHAEIEPQSIQKCNLARAAASHATRHMCQIVSHLRKKGI